MLLWNSILIILHLCVCSINDAYMSGELLNKAFQEISFVRIRGLKSELHVSPGNPGLRRLWYSQVSKASWIFAGTDLPASRMVLLRLESLAELRCCWVHLDSWGWRRNGPLEWQRCKSRRAAVVFAHQEQHYWMAQISEEPLVALFPIITDSSSEIGAVCGFLTYWCFILAQMQRRRWQGRGHMSLVS